MTVAVPVLYVVAFALFILGLSGLTGPRTAVPAQRSESAPARGPAED